MRKEPWTILIDSMEQHPFTFAGLHDPAHCVWRALGAAHGDYSIDGYQGRIHVERKSTEDAAGTFLGWKDRRRRFETELETFAQMEYAAVVVECSLLSLVNFVIEAPQRGVKTQRQNASIIYRSIISWQSDFRVPWFFCDERRFAEVTAYRFLERSLRECRVKDRAAEKQAKAIAIKERMSSHAGNNETPEVAGCGSWLGVPVARNGNGSGERDSAVGVGVGGDDAPF
jgi:hypothetical protein